MYLGEPLKGGLQPGMAFPPTLGRNLATFNLSLLILQKLKVTMVFALELKLSETLRGLAYFVLQL